MLVQYFFHIGSRMYNRLIDNITAFSPVWVRWWAGRYSPQAGRYWNNVHLCGFFNASYLFTKQQIQNKVEICMAFDKHQFWYTLHSNYQYKTFIHICCCWPRSLKHQKFPLSNIIDDCI